MHAYIHTYMHTYIHAYRQGTAMHKHENVRSLMFCLKGIEHGNQNSRPDSGIFSVNKNKTSLMMQLVRIPLRLVLVSACNDSMTVFRTFRKQEQCASCDRACRNLSQFGFGYQHLSQNSRCIDRLFMLHIICKLHGIFTNMHTKITFSQFFRHVNFLCAFLCAFSPFFQS
jgi:hypothetical protein